MSVATEARPLTALEQNALWDLEDVITHTEGRFTLSDLLELERLHFNIDLAVNAYNVTYGTIVVSKSSGFMTRLGELVERGQTLTEKQKVVALNIIRETTLGLPSSYAKPDLRVGTSARYKCGACDELFDTLKGFTEHRMAKHGYTPAFGSAEMAEAAPVKVLADAPETGLDISSIPDGYYAVYLPNSHRTSDTTFLQIKRLRKNRSLRNRRFRTGKVLTGAEFVPAGTIEVRELSSDAKRLAGEQYVKEGGLYRGEFEGHLDRILFNPLGCSRAFAAEIRRCGRCGKTLTDDISRSDGFGPECIHYANDHFTVKDWSHEYADAAKYTCPAVGCKKTDGVLVAGETSVYTCSDGHFWVVR
jgi:hypothetical protein